MKAFELLLLLTMSMASVFAKGGYNDWIPGLNFQQRLKAAKQVNVIIQVKNNLSSFINSANEFASFIGRLGGNLAQSYSVSRSVHSHSFCLQSKSSSEKKSLSNSVRGELKLYPEDVSIKIYDSLSRPCN